MVPQVRYSPFDDSLYITRAYHLLMGNFFGDFNSFTLAKLPGISFWLHFSRLLDLTYLKGINVLYICVGIYGLLALKKSYNNNLILVIIFIIFLINPITFSASWILIMREPVSCILIIGIVSSCIHIVNSKSQLARIIHCILFGIAFAFSMLLREEDQLLWIYLFGFVALLVFLHCNSGNYSLRNIVIVFLIPAALAVSVNQIVRSSVQNHYGLPIINDYSEGEFPKMIAAIRGIESKVDNRLVMIPSDAIQKLSQNIPEFSRIANQLPGPGMHTYSCKLHGVCSEWSNGWMPWFLKQAAFEAGFTPTLKDSQNFFKKMREDIEFLCLSGKLECESRGSSILPPMELRWSRAYFQEFRTLIMMLIFPKVDIVIDNSNAWNASADLVNMYHEVTMMPKDKQLEIDRSEESYIESLIPMSRQILAFFGGIFSALLITGGTIALLWTWVMYPNIKATSLYYFFCIIWIYSIIRISALAYVAVFLGPFDTRIIFSTYTALTLLSPFALWECYRAKIKYNLLLDGD
jgi:hypothetical protein